jgi:hypothetical protein
VKKTKSVGTTKWDGCTLSKEQVIYASIDACISHRIGVHLNIKPE